jgi:4-amino-4-deoxy-L-arabinose transferase-like glycosyltransferase
MPASARPLLATSLLYLAIVSCWLIVLPAFEGPDELHHYDYARYVSVTGHLPDYVPDTAMPGGYYGGLWTQEGLYYWLYGQVLRAMGVGGATIDVVANPRSTFSGGREVPLLLHDRPLSAALARGILVGRLANALFGLVTVIAVFVALSHVTRRPDLAAFATASLVLIPEFGVRHAFVSNDPMVTMWSSVAVALALYWSPRKSWWAAAWIGATTGLAIATKLTAGVLILLFPIVCGIEWRRNGDGDGGGDRTRSRLLPHAIAWAVGLIAMGAWPFVRNWIVFGDPLATALKNRLIALLGFQVVFDPTSLDSYRRLADVLFRSFWAAIGWAGFGPDAAWVWIVYDVMTVLVIVCIVIALLPRKTVTAVVTVSDGDLDEGERRAIVLCAIIVVLHLVAMFIALARVPGNTARYVLPIILPLLVLAVIGARRLAAIVRVWSPQVSPRWIAWAGVVALALAWLQTARETARAFHGG